MFSFVVFLSLACVYNVLGVGLSSESNELVQMCMDNTHPDLLSHGKKPRFIIAASDINCFIVCKVSRYGHITAEKHCCSPGTDLNEHSVKPFFCKNIRKCCKHHPLLHYNEAYCNPKSITDKLTLKKLPKKCPTEFYPGTESAKCQYVVSKIVFEAKFFQLTKYSPVQIEISLQTDIIVNGSIEIEILKFGLDESIASESLVCRGNNDIEVKKALIKHKVEKLGFMGKTDENGTLIEIKMSLKIDLESIIGRAMRFDALSGEKRCCNIVRVPQE